MTTAAVTVAHTRRDVLNVSGPDAVTYLQGQLSQDVAGLDIGASAATFVLAPQGKVDGWGRVLRRDEDELEIDVDPGAGAAWEARLRRFLLRTKADIVLTPDVATVSVRGAEVEGGRAPIGVGIVGRDLIGVDIEGAVLPDGAVEIDEAAAEAIRIRAGVPVWGAELDEDTIPATVGQWAIDASVSFTKGCYTGQELVARIDSRGGNVPRRLVGIEVDGPAPAPGTTVVAGGEELTVVTSSAPDATGGSVALAYLPRAVALDEAGIEVAVGGSPARLRSIPLGR